MTREKRQGKKRGARQQWRTGRELSARIVERHGIDLDAFADHSNTVVSRYIGPPLGDGFGVGASGALRAGRVARGALGSSWGRWGRRVFMNPPFALLLPAVRTAVESLRDFDAPLDVVVVVAPANPDTRWFRLLVDVGARIGFFSGRVSFEPPHRCECVGRPLELEGVCLHCCGHVPEDGEAPIVGRSAGFPTMLAVLDRTAANRPLRAPGVASCFDLLDPHTGECL